MERSSEADHIFPEDRDVEHAEAVSSDKIAGALPTLK